MNLLKLSPSDPQAYSVENVELFETKTEKRPPYYQRNTAGEMSYFAVCPACLNPIQLIGLYRKSRHTDKPYGRHYPHSVSGLALYYQEYYHYCPYRVKRQRYTKHDRRNQCDKFALDIIRVVISKFDKIIYFLSKETGLFISETLAEKMIDEYFASQAYLYPGATLLNVPLIFAYFSGTHSLYGRYFKSNQELVTNVMATIPDEVYWDEKNLLKTTGKRFIDISFCFRNHHIQLIEAHELSEQIVFSAAYEHDGEIRNIYEKVISFDPVYSQNLLNYEAKNLPEKTVTRNTALLALAEQMAARYGF